MEASGHSHLKNEQDDEPITFASMGLPVSSTLQDTVVGKIRPFTDITPKERAFLCLMLLSILAVIAFTIYRVATVSHDNPDFTLGLVLLLQAAFCLVYVFDGILRERPSEIFILTIATFVIGMYLIVNYIEGQHTEIKLIRMIVASCFAPILIGLGLYIAWDYHVSKKIIFRTVGADPKWQHMLHNLLVFQDFLKFDLQLGGSMVILILVSGTAVSLRDIIVLAVGVPATIAWFLLGYFAMAAESKPVAIVFALFSPAEVLYICYKLYTVGDYMEEHGGLASATILCSIVALIARCSVMILFYLVFRNFDKGLKEQVKDQAA